MLWVANISSVIESKFDMIMWTLQILKTHYSKCIHLCFQQQIDFRTSAMKRPSKCIPAAIVSLFWLPICFPPPNSPTINHNQFFKHFRNAISRITTIYRIYFCYFVLISFTQSSVQCSSAFYNIIKYYFPFTSLIFSYLFVTEYVNNCKRSGNIWWQRTGIRTVNNIIGCTARCRQL